MTHAVLRIIIEFRERFSSGRIKKDRIVSESEFAVFFSRNRAANFSVTFDLGTVAENQQHRATKLRGALVLRYVLHLFQQCLSLIHISVITFRVRAVAASKRSG